MYLCNTDTVFFKCYLETEFLFVIDTSKGLPVALLVEALRYKPEGRRFDSQWCEWDTHVHLS